MGANDIVHPVILTGEDQTSAAWESVKRQARDTGSAIDQLKGKFSALGGPGGAINSIGDTVGTFQRLRAAIGLPTLAVAALGAGAVVTHMNLIDLADAAEKAGVKASAVDALGKAIDRAGGKGNDAAAAIKNMRTVIDQMSSGPGQLVTSLRELFELNKVSLTDASGKLKGLPAIYDDVARMIVKAANDTDRLTIATLTWGEQAAGLGPLHAVAVLRDPLALLPIGK